MKSTAMRDLPHSIALVERRIELRRARLARHTDELRESAEQKAKPIALAGVAAVAFAGFFLGRGAPRRAARRAVGVAAKTGAVATLAAVVQGLISLAGNPLVRSAWRSYTQRRDRQPLNPKEP